jgi:hypothetical protein
VEARDAAIVRPLPGRFPSIPASENSETTMPAAVELTPSHIRDSQSAPVGPHDQSSSAQRPSRQRAQQLLDELQKEIQKLSPGVDSRVRSDQ